MSQIEKHLKWCLNDEKRLKRVKPNKELAQQHLAKSEYNAQVLRELEKLKRFDWALNVGFYAIYHCFLAILAKYGYESRNQSCTITTILTLIDEQKLSMERDLVLRFDTLEADKDATATVRQSREISTYGVSSTVDTDRLSEIKELIKAVQRSTIQAINS